MARYRCPTLCHGIRRATGPLSPPRHSGLRTDRGEVCPRLAVTASGVGAARFPTGGFLPRKTHAQVALMGGSQWLIWQVLD